MLERSRRAWVLGSYAAGLQSALEAKQRKVIVKGLKGPAVVDRLGRARVKVNRAGLDRLITAAKAEFEATIDLIEKGPGDDEANVAAPTVAKAKFEKSYDGIVEAHAPRGKNKITFGPGGTLIRET